MVTKTEKFGLPLQKKKNGEYKIPREIWYIPVLLRISDRRCRRMACRSMGNDADTAGPSFYVYYEADRQTATVPAPDWGDGYDNVTICCTMENQTESIIAYLFIKKSY